MRRTKLVTSLIAASAISLVGLGSTAAHAAPGDTATTFTLTGGSLAISVPATASLAGTTTGSASLSGALGSVTVTDPRGALSASWTSSVASTAFTTGASPTADETVPAASISYSSGAGTALAGQLGAMTPGTVAALSASPQAANTWLGVGNNTVTWNPTVTFTLRTSQVAGAYSGTITHSVA